MRFTITRPNNGWSSDVSHNASAFRRCGTNITPFGSSIAGPAFNAAGNPGSTLVSFVLEIAANQDVCLGNDLFVPQHIGRRRAIRSLQIRFAKPLQHRIAFHRPRSCCLDGWNAPFVYEPPRLRQQRKAACRGLNIEQTPQWNLAFNTTGENRGHAVIIALADRIELVIVASRAADGEPRNAAPDRIDRVARHSARNWSP